MTTKWPKRTLVATLVIGSAVAFTWLIPKPLAGYWHTPYSDCLCSSKCLLQFRNGVAYRWALAHGIVDEPYGTYRRGLWWTYWDTGEEVIRIRPGFFFMEVRPPDGDPHLKGMKWKGYREWRSNYIFEVLNYKQNGSSEALIQAGCPYASSLEAKGATVQNPLAKRIVVEKSGK